MEPGPWHVSHPEDRAWYWQAGGGSLGDIPPALPPQPWGRRLNHKGKLAIPFPKLLSPTAGNPK